MVWLRAASCTMLAYYENVLYGDEGLKIRGIDNELGYFWYLPPNPFLLDTFWQKTRF